MIMEVIIGKAPEDCAEMKDDTALFSRCDQHAL
jgi:hypothetical protein